MEKLNISRNVKYEIVIAVSLCIWTILFLILIGPFDASTVSMKNRMYMMPGYGLILFISYILIIPIQIKMLKSNYISQSWNMKFEIVSVFALFAICLLPTFLYYKSDFILGEASFLDFVLNIYFPLQLIIFPLVIILRWVARHIQVKVEKVITLGKNKYDKIRLQLSDLVFIKASDNYVEIHYLENDKLKLKMIRSTLKEMQVHVPELIQTHRSYLLNSKHFITWNSKNSISVTASEIPVSETFKSYLIEVL